MYPWKAKKKNLLLGNIVRDKDGKTRYKLDLDKQKKKSSWPFCCWKIKNQFFFLLSIHIITRGQFCWKFGSIGNPFSIHRWLLNWSSQVWNVWMFRCPNSSVDQGLNALAHTHTHTHTPPSQWREKDLEIDEWMKKLYINFK